MTRQEAISQIKTWDFLDDKNKEVLKTLITELQKSEDKKWTEEENERIRKCLISFFQRFPYCPIESAGTNAKEALAWLEKQGNKEYVLKSSKHEDVYKFMEYIEKEAKAYDFNLPNRGYDIYAFAKDLLIWIEKQGQSTSDKCKQEGDRIVENSDGTHFNLSQLERVAKVEPKFKVGGFIKHNKANIICKVISVNGSSYYVENIETSSRIELFNAEQNFHLWSIQDAKDGDVLAFKDDSYILLVKEVHNTIYGMRVSCYCHVLIGKFETAEYQIRVDGLYPATKEQRDTLFAAMKNAGYEWVAEKKELKRLEKQGEQKPINKVEPKFEIEKGKWYVCNTSRYTDFIVGEAYYCPENGMLKPNENAIARYVARDCFHLWTLRDAKDGDVLATSAGAFIYNGNNGGGSCPGCYCGINTLGRFKVGVEHHWTGKKVYPATKEQRDTLFAAMKNAGYEWVAEKKELKRLEKQDEQKPIDMVKPKFHEGDLVVDNCGYVWKIEGILNQFYILEGVEGGESRPTIEWVNKTFHLWTIQDAKDGDVLSYVTDEDDLWIMIYRSLYKPYEGHVHYHALLVNDKFSDKGTCCICISGLKPATKEQRELLFKKMKDSGYEWNSEKKELIQVEKQGEKKPTDKVESNFHE